MSENNYWFGKNVFITGINGFIGGNLAKNLIVKGANVFGLLRNQRRDTFLYYEGLAEKVTLIKGDLVNKDILQRIISEEQINCVFHLAAQVEIGVGIDNPYLTFETNIKGSYCLLEAIEKYSQSIESIIIASSDKSYGSYGRDKMPYKENYPLIPTYPYDVSKACADMIARCYASEIYNLPIIVTRFCNIFGPGQLNFSALIPDAIRSALGYSRFVPRGSGEQGRDFLYIDDVIDLYLIVAQSLANNPKKFKGEVFNAGTNSVVSVKSVIEEIYTIVGNDNDLEMIKKQMIGKKTTGEIDCQFMDFEKVNNNFGWRPKQKFTEGIVKSIDWYKTYLNDKYEFHA